MKQANQPKENQKVKRPRTRRVQGALVTTAVLIQAILSTKIDQKTVEGVKFTKASLYQGPDTGNPLQILVTSDGRVFNGEHPYTLQDSSGSPLQVPAKNAIQLTINTLMVIQHPEGQHPSVLILKRVKPGEMTFKVDLKGQENGSLEGLGALKTYSVYTVLTDQNGSRLIAVFDGAIKFFFFSPYDNIVDIGLSIFLASSLGGYTDGIIQQNEESGYILVLEAQIQQNVKNYFLRVIEIGLLDGKLTPLKIDQLNALSLKNPILRKGGLWEYAGDKEALKFFKPLVYVVSRSYQDGKRSEIKSMRIVEGKVEHIAEGDSFPKEDFVLDLQAVPQSTIAVVFCVSPLKPFEDGDDWSKGYSRIYFYKTAYITFPAFQSMNVWKNNKHEIKFESVLLGNRFLVHPDLTVLGYGNWNSWPNFVKIDNLGTLGCKYKEHLEEYFQLEEGPMLTCVRNGFSRTNFCSNSKPLTDQCTVCAEEGYQLEDTSTLLFPGRVSCTKGGKIACSKDTSLLMTAKQDGCFNCKQKFGTMCAVCFDGYPKCINCLPGTYLNEETGKCTSCKEIDPKCTQCSKSDATGNPYCHICEEGFYLTRDSKSCKPCQENCTCFLDPPAMVARIRTDMRLASTSTVKLTAESSALDLVSSTFRRGTVEGVLIGVKSATPL